MVWCGGVIPAHLGAKAFLPQRPCLRYLNVHFMPCLLRLAWKCRRDSHMRRRMVVRSATAVVLCSLSRWALAPLDGMFFMLTIFCMAASASAHAPSLFSSTVASACSCCLPTSSSSAPRRRAEAATHSASATVVFPAPQSSRAPLQGRTIGPLRRHPWGSTSVVADVRSLHAPRSSCRCSHSPTYAARFVQSM